MSGYGGRPPSWEDPYAGQQYGGQQYGGPGYDPYGYGSQDPYAQHYAQQPPPVQHHYYGASPVPAVRPTNGMATASLVCGLIGFFACGLTSVLAIIFGHVEIGRAHV